MNGFVSPRMSLSWIFIQFTKSLLLFSGLLATGTWPRMGNMEITGERRLLWMRYPTNWPIGWVHSVANIIVLIICTYDGIQVTFLTRLLVLTRLSERNFDFYFSSKVLPFSKISAGFHYQILQVYSLTFHLSFPQRKCIQWWSFWNYFRRSKTSTTFQHFDSIFLFTSYKIILN